MAQKVRPSKSFRGPIWIALGVLLAVMIGLRIGAGCQLARRSGFYRPVVAAPPLSVDALLIQWVGQTKATVLGRVKANLPHLRRTGAGIPGGAAVANKTHVVLVDPQSWYEWTLTFKNGRFLVFKSRKLPRASRRNLFAVRLRGVYEIVGLTALGLWLLLLPLSRRHFPGHPLRFTLLFGLSVFGTVSLLAAGRYTVFRDPLAPSVGPGIQAVWPRMGSYGGVLIAFAALSLLWTLVSWFTARPEEEARQCAQCGYNLTGNVSGVCPECGTSIPSGQPSSHP